MSQADRPESRFIQTALIILVSLVPLWINLYMVVPRHFSPYLGATIDHVFGEDEPPEITWIDPRGPVARAGLQDGDVIIEIDGRELGSTRALESAISAMRIGSTVPFKIETSEGARTIPVRVSLDAPKGTGLLSFLTRHLLLLLFWLAAVIAVLKGRNRREHLVFALFCFTYYCLACSQSVSLPLIAELMTTHFHIGHLIWPYCSSALLLLMATAFLHLFLIFPSMISTEATSTDRYQRLRSRIRRWMWLIYLAPQVWLWPGFFSRVITGSTWRGYRSLAGMGTTLLVLLVVLYSAGLIFFLLSCRKDPDPDRRAQERVVFAGISISLLAPVGFLLAFSLIARSIEVESRIVLGLHLLKYGFIIVHGPMLLMILTFMIGFYRYRLAEIDFLVDRAVLIALMIAISIVIFTIVEWGLSSILVRYLPDHSAVGAVISSIIVALVFAPARNRVDKFLARWL